MSKPVQTYIPFDNTALKGLAPEEPQGISRPSDAHSGAALAQFKLKHLDLNYAVTFNDTGMRSLKGKTTLPRLYLRGTSITDAGIENLAGLT